MAVLGSMLLEEEAIAKSAESLEAGAFYKDAHRKVFETLDERLAASEWLIGERLSVLDIAWFITTRRLSLAGYPLARHVHLARWHERLVQRPAFASETSNPALLRAVLPIYALFRRLRGTRLADVTR